MIKVIGMTPSYNDAKILAEFFETLNNVSPKIAYHLFATNNCVDPTPKLIDNHLKRNLGEHLRFNLPRDFIKMIEEPYAGVGIARQYLLKRAREMMLADKSYTHALCLDTDVFMADPDALTKITAWQTDIIGGSYLRNFPDGTYLATRFITKNKEEKALKEKIFYDLAIPFVTSAGFLCLSRRAVLDDRLRFFPIWKTLSNGHVNDDTSEDFGFCLLAQKYDYTTFVDGTVRLTHLAGPKQRGFLMGPAGKYNEFNYN